MITVGIVANGPVDLLPDLRVYNKEIDVWIGADRGALVLLENDLPIRWALGDFDSITEDERTAIQHYAEEFEQYPSEKDATDLEFALDKGMQLQAETIYLFGVTGGRFDHTLINVQTLYNLHKKNIRGMIIDTFNQIELKAPGEHIVERKESYPYISFVPITFIVDGLTLKGFYYPLHNEKLQFGSTLCISNKLIAKSGTFFFEAGILLLIKSRDSHFNQTPM